jgi:uncharacterized protein (DUF1697 family)
MLGGRKNLRDAVREALKALHSTERETSFGDRKRGVSAGIEAGASLGVGTVSQVDMRVALLRGINVGRAKRVAMADLRMLVTDLGYRDVRTLLNSGNVVFSVPKAVRGDPAAKIEAALDSTLGVASRVLVMTAEEIAEVVDDNPLRQVAQDPSRLLVMVLADAAVRKRLQALAREPWGRDALALGKRVAYLWCAQGTIDSRLMLAVSRLVGEGGTARNMATMTRLRALMTGL